MIKRLVSADSFSIPPHVGLPTARDEFVKLFSPPLREKSEGPLGVVVHPDWDVEGADMYIMAGASAIEGDAQVAAGSIHQDQGVRKARYCVVCAGAGDAGECLHVDLPGRRRHR